jgi:hypothetical protein
MGIRRGQFLVSPTCVVSDAFVRMTVKKKQEVQQDQVQEDSG